jgi:hypothetical protein
MEVERILGYQHASLSFGASLSKEITPDFV